ncbi:TonB-dependent receptor [Flavitalea sp.]|nr:TonB-dependent receptor [Flavitalea sp.]
MKLLLQILTILALVLTNAIKSRAQTDSAKTGITQTEIKGKVMSDDNEPLSAATIRIKFSGAGTSTDPSGRFSIITTKPAPWTLIVSCVGYQAQELSLATNQVDEDAKIIMQHEIKAMGEVVVVAAGTFEASDKAKGASLTPMDAMTVAGNGGDIANSLRSLPGTQQVGEKEGLFVRGGTSEEAKQFVDGTLLRNPNYNSVPGILQPARLNPFLFKGVLYSTGGYSALYGQAMSSALILETVDLPDVSSIGLAIFPMVVAVNFQELGKKGNSSYGASANFGNQQFYNKMINAKPDFFNGPQYLSGDANFRLRTSKTGMLKFYATYGYDRTGMRNPDPDSLQLLTSYDGGGSNIYSNLSYRELLANNWKIDAALSYNYHQRQVTNRLLDAEKNELSLTGFPFNLKNFESHNQSNFAQARLVLGKTFSNRRVLRFGAEYFFSDDKYKFEDTVNNVKDNLVAGFVESDVYLARHLAAKIGLRGEYSYLLRKAVIAPRLSIAYRFNNGGQLNIAYGRFYQKPEPYQLIDNANPDFSDAQHFILNYQKNKNNRWLRMEAYYKLYKRLATTYPYSGNTGDGYARGFEVFFRDKKTIRDLDYWISYTYLDTKRKYLDYPYAIRPGFSTPHTASIAIKRFYTDLSMNLNVSYSFATGRPYYFINNRSGGVAEIQDQGTTRTYSNMNISFAYLFSMFKKWKHKDFSGIGLGMNNVFGRNQVFGYNYGLTGANKIPISLPATRTFYFGIFMGFGTDTRDNIMDQNL